MYITKNIKFQKLGSNKNCFGEHSRKLSYTSSECDTLEYTTKSTSASGAVDKIHLVSSGTGYKKLPLFNGVNKSNGKNLLVSLETNTIGKVLETKIVNEDLNILPDKTLQPEASSYHQKLH